MKTKVTIGITAFQEGELLQRAWQSILNQTNPNWNAVIVLDGGADEETIKIFESIDNSRLTKFKFEENQGPYLTRTKAIELTETEWFYFLDGDDTLPLNAIELFFKSVRDYHFFYWGNVKLIHQDGNVVLLKHDEFTPSAMILRKKSPAVVAFKKELFYELKGYDSRLLRGRADYDFLFKLYKSEKPNIYINEIIYEYHLRNGSVSRSYLGELGNRNLIIYYNNRDVIDSPQLKYQFLFNSFISSFNYNLLNNYTVRTKLYSLRILHHFPQELDLLDKILYSSPFLAQKIIFLLKRGLNFIKRHLKVW